jgi:hypothetical protein
MPLHTRKPWLKRIGFTFCILCISLVLFFGCYRLATASCDCPPSHPLESAKIPFVKGVCFIPILFMYSSHKRNEQRY